MFPPLADGSMKVFKILMMYMLILDFWIVNNVTKERVVFVLRIRKFLRKAGLRLQVHNASFRSI